MSPTASSPASSPASSTGPRRQVDRRSATTDKLLDATIECLAELGYVATTTRRVAERAGVSQGAQQHYFPTKAALVDAAMVRLTEQLMADAIQRGVKADDELERAGELLDMIWEIHNLPVTPAVLELFTVARTDPKLARRVAELTGAGMAGLQLVAAQAIPTYAARPGFAELLQIVMATLRGTVIIAAIPGAEASHPSWSAVRAHLMASLEAL